MTRQSSEVIEDERRVDGGGSGGVVDSDESRIVSTLKDLRNSGWYWGSLTANGAKEVLQDRCEGTFLLRDSSQRDFLFTLSAMTAAGPTHLRIHFKQGRFHLDSGVLVQPRLKQFQRLLDLVEFYVQLSGTREEAPPTTSGPNGMVQLLLTTPVYTTVPSLQHLCRVAVNRTTGRIQDLPIPNRLKDYLMDYTYHL